jgi:hypothetical protein
MYWLVITPHLEHPSESGVRLTVRLHLHREIVPQRCELAQVVHMHHGRRWPHGWHIVLSEAGHPLLGDAATLRIFWAHVREEEGDAQVRSCAVGHGLPQQVIRLGNVHIVLGDPLLKVGPLEPLHERPRPVDHGEASRLVEAQLLDHHRWDDLHQLVLAPRQQPREARHLAAAATLALHPAEVVVEDFGLPLLIQAVLRGQNRMVRSPPGRARAGVALIHDLLPRDVVGVRAVCVRHWQPVG